MERLDYHYKTLFNTEAGKKVLLDLANRCRIARVTHVPGDTHETAFNEGRRSVYIYIAKMVSQKIEEALINPNETFKGE